MHEYLYGAVAKRLPYVLNMGCRAITKATLNVHSLPAWPAVTLVVRNDCRPSVGCSMWL